MNVLRNIRGNSGMFFMGLLSMIITLAIILYLFYTMTKAYFKPVVQDAKSESQPLFEQGINTSTYKSIIDTTKDKLNDITRQQESLITNLTNPGK